MAQNLKESENETVVNSVNNGADSSCFGSRNSGGNATETAVIKRHPLGAVISVIAVVAIATAGYFVWLEKFHPYESTDDAFIEARSFPIAVRVPGYVESVSVTDNQHVDAGTSIARITARDYQIAVDQATGLVEAAKAAIESADAQVGVSDASIAEAQAQQTSAQAALQYAKDEANRQSDLVKGGVGTVQSAQQSEADLRQAQATFNQADASIVSAMKNKVAAQAQRASALASLKQAMAQQESAEQNLHYTDIKVEQSGRVVQLSGAKGQFVEAGQSIAMFVPDEMWVVANFKETQLSLMRPGQPVELTIDAYPNRVLHGKIASVQPGSGTAFSLLPAENATGNYVKVTQRVPVKITVEQWPTDVAIGPGMSVVPTVTVHLEQ